MDEMHGGEWARVPKIYISDPLPNHLPTRGLSTLFFDPRQQNHLPFSGQCGKLVDFSSAVTFCD